MSLINVLRDKALSQEVFYSFEYFPPTSERGRQGLLKKIYRMAEMQPVFVSVTCAKRNREESLILCRDLQKFCGVNVMMHISCSGFTRESLISYLHRAKQYGIQNLLAICGDDYDPATDIIGGSLEMIKIIREEFHSYFTIGVVGYPEGCGSYPAFHQATHLQLLKDKVNAGADFCISQAIFDIESFEDFVSSCHENGISKMVPIIPGIIVVHSYDHIKRISEQCHIRIPENIMSKFRSFKEDSANLMSFGVDLAAALCRELEVRYGGMHFFTFNMEHSIKLLLEERLQITPKNQLPWRASLDPKRHDEEVRPIFWANRPSSYVQRTGSWDKFPAGRWGDLNADFGSQREMDLTDANSPEIVHIRRKFWGESPQTESEIFEVFASFIEGKIPFLPWCEESLHIETSSIKSKLEEINRSGFLTINSQPRVNAVPSSDPRFGWGPDGGYVYQKAYIEFFTSAKNLRSLIDLCGANGPYAGSSLVYHAVDSKGNTYSNNSIGKPCAVTWGVFPGKEIMQPTVVDPESFLVWKDEAFSLWLRQWASIYHEDSYSYDLIHDIHDQYFLVNIVENDFVNGDIFRIFDDLVRQTM